MPQLDLGLVMGPQGPQGPEGPAGPQGPQGPQGEQAKVVNDLTTGGADAALSAEQGKVLGAALSNKADKGPPQVYDLPLTDGFSVWGACSYFKTQDGIVTVNVNIGSTPVTSAGNEAVIGNLPEGFRPTRHVIAAAYCNHGNDLNSKPGYIFVDYLGTVRMRGDADWTLGHASVTFFAP